MKRYPRIAFSAVCGILCLLLIALWVRSYRWIENFTVLVSSTRTARIHSGLGKLQLDSTFDADAAWQFPTDRGWRFTRYPAQIVLDELMTNGDFPTQPNFGFKRPNNFRWHVLVRHWILVVISGVLAAVLGIRRPWRFSLRTLLIAMTLVAVVLGLVVALH